jgi:uncharacterized phage protein (TIGR02218 family)
VRGTITFTSGANSGVIKTVQNYSDGTPPILQLIYPLEYAPATGDTFTASYGCDKSLTICQSRFNNTGNYRGFPYTPDVTVAY